MENIKRAYITHVTRDYLQIAFNLARSVRLFSDIPLIIYCINMEGTDVHYFNSIRDVDIRNIKLDIPESLSSDYINLDSGNFYINRQSNWVYNVLCVKTIAMKMALEEGWDEICYLDSDCIATPIIDQLFEWTSIIEDYPIATQGIHEYMMVVENGVEYGNPFAGGSWPNPDNKLCLEWPLMNFLEMSENGRGEYRTTNILLSNKKCLPFIKTWSELCYILPKLVNTKKYAPYHEETIYNALCWKKTNKGFPLCYINLAEGLKTVNHFYTEGQEGYHSWDETDTNKRFYKIPDNKRNIKVLHGEKRKDEVDKIINYLQELKNKNYFHD